MLTATITAKFVNPPRAGKKSATIKDTSDKIWLLPPTDLGKFQVGGTYEVAYENVTFNNGASMPAIKASKSVVAPPTGSVTGSSYGHVDATTAERIFVCGAYNAILSSIAHGQVPTEDQLVAIVNTQRRIWQRTFGGKPTVGDEMNDSLPDFV